MNNKIYNNLSRDNLMKTDWFEQFNLFQRIQIKRGLEDNLNVCFYANKEFKAKQMNEIRLGLIDNLDVSIYAKPEYTAQQMKQFRLKLLDESTL